MKKRKTLAQLEAEALRRMCAAKGQLDRVRKRKAAQEKREHATLARLESSLEKSERSRAKKKTAKKKTAKKKTAKKKTKTLAGKSVAQLKRMLLTSNDVRESERIRKALLRKGQRVAVVV